MATRQTRLVRRLANGVASISGAPPITTCPPPVLLRDYVAACLASYFSRPGPACPVGSGARLPPVASLADRAAYDAAVAKAYAAQPGAWLTPAELFSPHYGAALAAFITAHHAPTGAPLHIIEVGAGRGTLARDVLSAVRELDGDGGLYSRTRYATLDVSPALAEEAARTVRAAGHAGLHLFTPTVGDACEPGAWAAVARALRRGGGGGASDPPSPLPPPPSPFIILCEVLDNLPHDKAVRTGAVGSPGAGWAQAMVAWAGPGGGGAPPAEVHAPLADPLVAACLAAALEEEAEGGGVDGGAAARSLLARLGDYALGLGGPPWRAPTAAGSGPGAADCLFLPTGAARLLDAAVAAFPCHTLLAFDFDALPTTLKGGDGAEGAGTGTGCCWGAPVVSGPPSPGQPARDYPDLLAAPPGTADIFFPTDFHLLARLARRVGVCGHRVDVRTTTMKSADFFRVHAPRGVLAATTTVSGWNPLLDDFTNTAAVIVERRGGPPSEKPPRAH
jgi:hypothetical protein